MKYKKIKGSIAGGHKKTCEAGGEILRSGGNIFDALVASAFAAQITEPLLTSLAGGGLAVFKPANERDFLVGDFFVNYPGLNGLSPLPFEDLLVNFGNESQLFHIGINTVAVPGNIFGLIELHNKYGRIPFSEVITPALEYSKNGIKLSSIQSMTLDLLEPLLSISQEGKNIFYPESNEGKRLKADEIITNKNYSDFLSHLRTFSINKSLKNYLENDFKNLINLSIDSLSNGPTNLSLKDLKNYKINFKKAYCKNINGNDFYYSGLPSKGGDAVITILDQMKFSRKEINKNFYQSIFEELKRYENSIENSHFKKGTTHISGMDELGNICSLSMTNGEGCGHYINGTGIMLNNMLGEDDLCPRDINHWSPGMRLGSMMAPMISRIGKNENNFGNEFLAIGAGGSKRIRSSVALITLLISEFEISLNEAINFPRINFDGSQFQIEPNDSKEFKQFLDSLEAREYNLWNGPDFYFGGVHGIQGINMACGDPRRDGHGLIVE